MTSSAHKAVVENPMERPSPAFVLLHEKDNILVCAQAGLKGDVVDIDGVPHSLPGPIGVGHKIARYNMAKGTKIMRYGFPIGTMTEAVKAAVHVHMNNLKSDYIPSHGRDAVHVKDERS